MSWGVVNMSWGYPLRDLLELLLAITKLYTVDEGTDNSSVICCAVVVPSEVLGQLLVVVEHGVSLLVLPNDSVRPQLAHEEHLI